MKSTENLARDLTLSYAAHSKKLSPRLYLTEKNRLQKLSRRDFLPLNTVEYRKPNFLFGSSVKLYCYFCQNDPTSRKIWKPFETLKIKVFNDKWKQTYGLNKVLKLAAALQTVFFEQTWCRYKMLRYGNAYVTKKSYVDGSVNFCVGVQPLGPLSTTRVVIYSSRKAIHCSNLLTWYCALCRILIELRSL